MQRLLPLAPAPPRRRHRLPRRRHRPLRRAQVRSRSRPRLAPSSPWRSLRRSLSPNRKSWNRPSKFGASARRTGRSAKRSCAGRPTPTGRLGLISGN
ncbi:hypothetical protein AFM18_14455 [Achromobacter spanius]|uniref:Uncharacterized protein n=1 Tax=Achromobacter spanius TaxID=217203 RepID=A0AAW3I2K0_9BURK|nr:hypothetical protein AFM18_14455 [Achromobacter spanius]